MVHRGVVEAAECFMTRWHRDEAESSWLRHAADDANSDDKGRRRGGATVLMLLSTNSEMKWLIVCQGTGSTNDWSLSCYNPRALLGLFDFR